MSNKIISRNFQIFSNVIFYNLNLNKFYFNKLNNYFGPGRGLAAFTFDFPGL